MTKPKVVVYMGQSLNGLITKDGDDTSFLSRKSFLGFQDHSQKAGNLIIGRTTYEMSLKTNYFPFKKALNIVMTHEPIKNRWGDKVIFTDKPPK
ncbi:MAG: hypothetical protein NUV69_00225, partial [Candidatus Curtissbacteria bacterium]|nr:hypothetical protein [Candidatus Curtissbacteria bacterium]